MYADGTKICGAYRSGNKDQVSQALSQSVNIVMEWTYAWQIPLNISKASVFHIGTSENVEYSLNTYFLY